MEEADRSYHPQLCAADADAVLSSIDDVHYRIPSFVLRDATGLFRNVETATRIPVSNHSRVLTPILLMLSGIGVSASSPLHFPVLTDLDEAVRVLITWDAPGPLSILRGSITSYIPLYDSIAKHNLVRCAGSESVSEPMEKTSIALRLFGLAMRMEWELEAKMLSKYTLAADIWHEQYKDDMHCVDSKGIMRLMRLRRERRDGFGRILDRGWGRLEGNAKLSFGIPTLEGSSRCRGCAENLICQPSYPYILGELKNRMFWEMDRFPLGDTLVNALETDVGDWSEAREVWSLKCLKCDKAVIDRVGLMRDVKETLMMLPCSI